MGSVGGSGVARRTGSGLWTNHGNRIGTLERRTFGGQVVSQRPKGLVAPTLEVAFSQSGVLAASGSMRYYPRLTARLASVVVSVDAAGSTDTVIEVRKNGTAITPISASGGVTIASSTLVLGDTENVGFATFDTSFSADSDYLTVVVTTAGTDAADLDVQARFG